MVTAFPLGLAVMVDRFLRVCWRRAFVLVLAAVSAGCISATPPPNLATASIGPPPAGYEETIKAAVSSHLKDPYSAVYTFQRPVRSWAFGEEQIMWAVCGTVNAKNSFGGYVGARPFVVYYKYGRVVDTWFREINTPNEHFGIDRECAKWHAAGYYE
jgi:hypothetical protein